jgi:mono/diheme cytochrome c family protein
MSLPIRFLRGVSTAVATVAGVYAPVNETPAAELPATARDYLQRHCHECHDAETKKGGLDLTALQFDLADAKTAAKWVTLHDRVRDGEMPPKKKPQPDPAVTGKFLEAVAGPLIAHDQARAAAEGRSTWRRLNRFEYENALRDLLSAPWLQLKDLLPEDGESHRFNKVGDALDVSHVQMGRYLGAADFALRQVVATSLTKPAAPVVRHYARDQKNLQRKMVFSVFNRSPERATFPLLDFAADLPVLEQKAPFSVGKTNAAVREREAFGVVASAYEPIEPKFDSFKAPMTGRYKLRFNGFTFWAGPESAAKWWKPSREHLSAGHRDEPVSIYSVTPPRQLRKLGSFDFTPEPVTRELDVYLLAGETIQFDAARLFRSRPPNFHNPLAEKDGQPGVAFRWMEAEGPLFADWPTAGHKLLFGDLALRTAKTGVEVVSAKPREDAERLLRAFLRHVYRGPVAEPDVQRFLEVITRAAKAGFGFADAQLAGYTAVLCSPAFLTLEEKPGRLDDAALAARLSFFLWNSVPDAELRAVAARGELHRPEVLRAQTARLLEDPKSRRFTDAFLNYWLDLRRAEATSPDAALYPDYYLDDLLVESAVEETRLFFAELLRADLPARTLVAADFVMVNERLAKHYGLPPVNGVALRRVSLPKDSPRGGLLTQASVLKVTANGTTTSPVLRGAWVMERMLGKPPPPPPPSVPAVEPDTRGAVTIREQLDKHRTLETCNACHAKIDPAGFALENFDVLGGWREKYRALGEGRREPGYGKNGQAFEFHAGPNVDASGELPDGRKFADIRDLKRFLLADEPQIARNLATQLIVYATGAPVRFGDRPQVEQLLARAASHHYGVRSLIHELVQSELFQTK